VFEVVNDPLMNDQATRRTSHDKDNTIKHEQKSVPRVKAQNVGDRNCATNEKLKEMRKI
jgi:hypothetical protein